LKDLQLKVARAWAAKELFSKFWEYQEEGWARRFFKDWFGWVSRSRLTDKTVGYQTLQSVECLISLGKATTHVVYPGVLAVSRSSKWPRCSNVI
jgi:hypothetical protein